MTSTSNTHSSSNLKVSPEVARARAVSGSLAKRKQLLLLKTSQATGTSSSSSSTASTTSTTSTKFPFRIKLAHSEENSTTLLHNNNNSSSSSTTTTTTTTTTTSQEDMPAISSTQPQSLPSPTTSNDSHQKLIAPPAQEKPRSRAIRISSSIRKAGNSLTSPRTATSTSTTTTSTTTSTTIDSTHNSNSISNSQRIRRTSRLFSPKSTSNSSSHTTPPSTLSHNLHLHSPASPATVCSVPMTPISPEYSSNSSTTDTHPAVLPHSDHHLTANHSAASSNTHTHPLKPASHLHHHQLEGNPTPNNPTHHLPITASHQPPVTSQLAQLTPSTSPEPFQPLSQHPLPLSNQHPVDLDPFSPNSSPILQPSTPSLIQDTTQSPSPPSDFHHQPSSPSTTPTASKLNPSQSILSIALSKAQTAVQLDTALQIPEAIHAYTEAVLLLEEVIDNIDVTNKGREQKELEALERDQAKDKVWSDEICKQLARKNLDDLDREELEARLKERERKWQEKKWKLEKRKKARAEEGERLIGIHNTYASRIAELQAEIHSNPHTIFPSDQSTESSTARHWSQPPDQPLPPSPSSNHHHQPLPPAERSSLSSDSTTREANQPQPLAFSSIHQPTNQDQPSLHSGDAGHTGEIEAEERKDIVSEKLPCYNSVHSQNSRNRASSSASLSQRGRTPSNENRTNDPNIIYNANQSRSSILNTPSEAQFDLSDAHSRSSVDHRPASRHSVRLSEVTLDSDSSQDPRTAVPSTNQNLRYQPSQKLLVSQTTTQGTISQRRRSPYCIDTARRSLTRSQGHDEPSDISPIKPIHSAHLSYSMNRRPSNLSLMGTVPSAAIPQRLRSFSQPGKRPGLPPSFLVDNSYPVPNSPLRSGLSPTPFPPNSSPLAANPTLLQDIPQLTGSASHLPAPGPSPLSQNPPVAPIHPNGVITRSNSQHALPSYEIQPYAHASLSPGSMYTGSPAPVGELPSYPKLPARRPFHLMRQIRASMSTGAYVSPRLYVPRQMWYQVQIKLHGLETKIKLMDTLIAGLELVERDGAGLVGADVPGSATKESPWDFGESRKPKPTTLTSQVLTATERFMKRLEIFEDLLDNLQTGGAKKLGLNASGLQETAYGQDTMRKGGGFGTLMAHKLGKGLDRINIGRGNADLPSLYVDTIARLFDKSQTIDAHLSSLELAARAQGSTSGTGLYGSIGQQSKQHIEGRLRRVSEFYSTVVCRFVVADMGVLLDKYVKRGGNWCSD
ncbi:hypothetical protein PCANC_19447 [Puccinia coronata f. sp. avenae]|uniref:MIT domain-containing protein n=1 Tax=Puccinia coronata f. sp. avenae TaxID=200324 RepID=A0A2N5UEZ3_9BASI|nr:hypothetical protein PCANC_19447 [Puccinia coronata f. sp. avenae]